MSYGMLGQCGNFSNDIFLWMSLQVLKCGWNLCQLLNQILVYFAPNNAIMMHCHETKYVYIYAWTLDNSTSIWCTHDCKTT